MSDFNFCTPSIHGVKTISARAQIVPRTTDAFACLHIVFHGADGEQQELEAYFGAAEIDKAVATAAAINAVSGFQQDEAEAA